ncbi:hypothetical protein [Streptomyces sp. NPDC127033]|uniref:hypothetical protein n=1 Tax=Streptomyces sp. NPDC127033 TaxID=3347110 RepID=UPI003669AB94
MEAQQDPEPSDASETQPPPPAALPARRRGRTALLIAVAAVLGIVGGTTTGYAIQADRPPTPLPPLAQQGLGYPAKPLPAGEEAEPLSAEEDRQVRTDGDLRKLLIGRPAGAREIAPDWLDNGWVPLRSYAHYFDDGAYAYSSALGAEMRRVAGTAWQDGESQGSVILVQYHPSINAQGPAELATLPAVMLARTGDPGEPVKGTAKARSWVWEEAGGADGAPPFRAYASAYRGDVLIKINLWDTAPIAKKDIRTLIERQLERL